MLTDIEYITIAVERLAYLYLPFQILTAKVNEMHITTLNILEMMKDSNAVQECNTNFQISSLQN